MTENIQNTNTLTERVIGYAFDFYREASVTKVALAILFLIPGANLLAVAALLTVDAGIALKGRLTPLPMFGNMRLGQFGRTLVNEKVEVLLGLNLALQPQTDETIKGAIQEAQKKDKDLLIFIPLILESRFPGIAPDHVVAIAVDIKNKQVEYYNSQGGNPESERRSIKAYDGNLQHLIQICENAISSTKQTIHNSKKIQRDHTSCGYFVANFMKERSGNNFEASKGEDKDVLEMRRKIDEVAPKPSKVDYSSDGGLETFDFE